MRLVFVFLLLIIFSCKKENESNSDFRNELFPYLNRLSKEKTLPVSDTVAKNYLYKNATKEELIRLMNSEIPLLRVVAYRLIIDREEPEYFDLLMNNLDDQAKVQWWYYEDAAGYFSVSDLMIAKAKDKDGFSPIQKKVLVDKVLLYYPELEVSNEMLRDIEPNKRYYNLIKERAILKSKNDRCGIQLGACFALSKFKKEEDVKVLKKVFEENFEGYCTEWIFKSIEKFPHQQFFPLLKQYFESKVKNKLNSENNISDEALYFSRAVAAYQNDKSLDILKYIEQNNTFINKPFWPPSNKTYVLKATMIHYNEIYNDLISDIKKQMDDCEIKNLGFGKDLLEYEDRQYW